MFEDLILGYYIQKNTYCGSEGRKVMGCTFGKDTNYEIILKL
jgi:hypothetical protein